MGYESMAARQTNNHHIIVLFGAALGVSGGLEECSELKKCGIARGARFTLLPGTYGIVLVR